MKDKSKITIDHDLLITSSWQRCDRFGLNQDSDANYSPISVGEIKDLKSEHRYLLGTTGQEVLPYYENILANSSCLVMLADQQGQVLNCWGDKRFMNKSRQRSLEDGTNWSEQINGTNAIGTAIATGQAVQIQRDEHYLKSNRFMIGSAAPIYDTNNELLAVLDVSSDAYLPQAHTFGMVKMMSQSVENRLIYSKFGDDEFLMTFNTNTDNLDSQWVGLIAFTESGIIISANRRAEMLLRVDLALKNIEEIFACRLFELKNQPEGQPISVLALGKYKMYATIQRPAKGYTVAPDYRQKQPTVAEKIEQPSIAISHGDPKVERCLRMARSIIEKDIPILLQGETGVGKTEFSKALHATSSRKPYPFITLNCASLSERTIESDLFGYDSEDIDAIGLIRKAHKGILFLDEVSEIPLPIQSKLLHVLEEREVHPLGSSKSYPVDIKIISSTKENLKKVTESGRFRDDLYFRISGLNLELPSFKERTDKQALIKSIHRAQREEGQPDELAEEVIELLAKHPWPGNFRQLKNVIHIALSMADQEPVQPWHLPDDFFHDIEEHSASGHSIEPQRAGTANQNDAEKSTNVFSKDSVNDDTLREYNLKKGNISRTAKALGISRNTLYKRLKNIGIKQ